MKVSDYIAQWLATVSPRVYAVCGAGAMHLNDSICHHPDLQVIAMHHEQAAAFAAEADARVSGKPGIVLVTAGPGGTNAITGIASAYVDSIPMIVIAGQVTTSTLKTENERQIGLNELDGTNIVKEITKYSATVMSPSMVMTHLGFALDAAVNGRPGPVWLEFPLDVQNAEMVPQAFEVRRTRTSPIDGALIDHCVTLLEQSDRPVLVVGNGAHGANIFKMLRHAMPIVSSWNGSDIVANDCPWYIGRMGIFGDRASNYAVQHADLIIALGTRFSIAQIGHHQRLFAPDAKKIIVDLDRSELNKSTVNADVAICGDAGQFCLAMELKLRKLSSSVWLRTIQRLRDSYPTMLPEYRTETQGVNAYHFVEQLNRRMADDAIVVTDVGIAYICTMQTLKLNGRQRLFHSGGVSAMGYGLPASIGAYRAGGSRQTICLAGDGGMMLNLQELQTIAHHNLPIKVFVFANNGYATIRMAQENHFGRHSISSPETGLSCPDFAEIGKAFGIPVWSMFDNAEVEQWMEHVLSRQHPMLCVVHISPNQKIAPRVQSKIKDGKFVPVALDDMWPPLEEVVSREGVGS